MADGKRRGDTPLDATSEQIIAQLQQDGRRPYATIGKEVGPSEAAVRQRVHRLREQGRIQIVAVADPAEVGFARIVEHLPAVDQRQLPGAVPAPGQRAGHGDPGP